MSQFFVPSWLLFGPGQAALDGIEYRAAKPWSRLSLSGSPPVSVFQAHWLMSIGSFDPPPVKIVQLVPPAQPGVTTAASSTHAVAVAPCVLLGVGQAAAETW